MGVGVRIIDSRWENLEYSCRKEDRGRRVRPWRGMLWRREGGGG